MQHNNKISIIINDINKLISFIESDSTKTVSNSIYKFKDLLNVIERINLLSIPENKVDFHIHSAALTINKDKISKIESFIQMAKTNLINIAEIHAYFFEFKDYIKIDQNLILAELNFSSENLESEVLKLIEPLSKKTDSQIADYIRTSLFLLKDIT